MEVNPFDLEPTDEFKVSGKELVELYEAGVFAGSMTIKGAPLKVQVDPVVTTKKQRYERQDGKYIVRVEDLCANCGAELQLWHQYCPLCGARFSGIEVKDNG